METQTPSDTTPADTPDDSTMPPPPPDTTEAGTEESGLKWWIEATITVAFYVVYSMVRNQFGSALGGDILRESYDNAILIIDLEKAMGLYHEELIQRTFLDWDAFVVFWNVFYGTFHFVVTIGAMVLAVPEATRSRYIVHAFDRSPPPPAVALFGVRVTSR